MPTIVKGNNTVQAWKAGSSAVLNAPHSRMRNLITEINDPLLFQADWLNKYNPQSVGEKDSVSVVAKVLFPSRPRRPNESRATYYGYWRSLLKRARESGALKAQWGTYFDRLVAFNETENQLESIIIALSDWGVAPEAALVAHTSAPTLDSLRPLGSPCLQYIEILQDRNHVIDLVAVYRNHDFLNKALGNFIGLARILKFIAQESGKASGKIVCHSVHAYCNGATKLRTLIGR